MGRLDGLVAVVTGAGRGLGRSIARALDAEGARLVLASRTAEELEALAEELGDAVAVPTDVRDPADVRGLFDAALGEFGAVDILVDNAGVAVYGPAETLGPDEVDLVIDTNVKGALYVALEAWRHMRARRRGHIVLVGSIAGRTYLPNETVYGASKWAITGFAGALALEGERVGVKVTCVAPGGIDTPFWRQAEFHPFPDHVDPERDFLDPDRVAGLVVEVLATPPEVAVPELVVLPVIPR